MQRASAQPKPAAPAETRRSAPRGVVWGVIFAFVGFWLPLTAVVIRIAQHR